MATLRDRLFAVFRVLSPPEWRLVLLVLVVKAVLLLYGVVLTAVYDDKAVTNALDLLETWNQWDGDNYLHIAQNGYQATGDKRFNIAFFPGYPLFIALGIKAGMPPVASAFAVSSVTGMGVAVLLFRLARLDGNTNSANRAVWFLFVFPTAYFLHTVSTESLFLFWTLGAILMARRRRWQLCGVFAFFAMITRMNALLLFPVLLIEAWQEWRETRKLSADWVFLLCPLVGLALYLQLNYTVTGNALTFLSYQREHWRHALTFPWIGLYNAFVFSLNASPRDAQMAGTQEFVFALIGLIGAILVAVRMRLSYGVWCIGNWILICSMDFLTSTPRYLLLFFPLFILWGQYTRRRSWFDVSTAISLLLFGLFAALYARTWWAF